MKWFYAKDGQQVGPVEFSEIERLRAEGQINDETLVWQQGTANWVKLSTVLRGDAPPTAGAGQPAASNQPAVVQPVSVTPLPDYGDFLCWGILAIVFPCIGLLVYIALVVLHILEFTAARKAVEEGRLQATDYSRMNPVLFVLGFVCCGIICYPLFMYYRNRSGYFKPQPYAVIVAVVAAVLCLGMNLALNFAAAFLERSGS